LCRRGAAEWSVFIKHLLTLNDLTKEEIFGILDLAAKLKTEQKKGGTKPVLKGKTLGMIFTKSSTRTRVSFEVGMAQLGGAALFLSANDIQLGRGETIYDTANVLSRYLDGIMIRTFAHSDVEDLAKYGTIPVINGLTDYVHPCQILADFQTILERKGRLNPLKLAYIGDGNNVAHSLLFGASKVGMDSSVASPEGYECDANAARLAKENAALSGSRVVLTQSPEEAIADADAVYADTWASMGREAEKEERARVFAPYQVNKELFSKAKPDAIFLHCLPAYRGCEVTEDVIDGPNSAVFDEAENRLHAQKAVLALLMNGGY
jgi:ornithine carbamoyltransferase